MRCFLIVCFSVFIFQTSSALPPAYDWKSHQIIYSISSGRYDAQFGPLNKQLERWGAAKQFDNFYYTLGFTSVELAHNVSTSTEWLLPRTIKMGGGDSLAFKLAGWHYQVNAFGIDLIPGDVVALVIGPGLDFGNLKMRRTLDGTKTKYRNPFVCGQMRADLRVVIGKIGIGARMIYRYDVTNEIWKRKADNLPVLPGTKMSGIGFQAFIGFGSINY